MKKMGPATQNNGGASVGGKAKPHTPLWRRRIAAYPDSSFTSNERAHRFDLRMVLSMEGIQCRPN
jgi:hypothetical protein